MQSDAGKLAGRLSWATQFLFRKLGRAMLRPIFDRAYSPATAVGEELRVALCWWLKILEQPIAENYPWAHEALAPAVVLVDARGVPPRCAAVLLLDGRIHFTDGAPADEVMASLEDRGDNQIGMSFPLSAVERSPLYASRAPKAHSRPWPSCWVSAPSSLCLQEGTLCFTETTQVPKPVQGKAQQSVSISARLYTKFGRLPSSGASACGWSGCPPTTMCPICQAERNTISSTGLPSIASVVCL